MATKTRKKKTTKQTKKITKREPSTSVVLKKVASVSDSNKALQKRSRECQKFLAKTKKS